MAVSIRFVFDTTGSMYPASTQVRNGLKQIARDLFADIPNLKIGFGAHGDFWDYNRSYVHTLSPMFSSPDPLVKWVNQVKQTDGGDWKECYGYVLDRVADDISNSDTEGDDYHLVMIGDAMPHEGGYTHYSAPPDPYTDVAWEHAAVRLRDMGVKIHAIQCLTNEREAPFWRALSRVTNGVYAKLGQFMDIGVAIKAMTLKHGNQERLVDYVKELDIDGMLRNKARARLMKDILRDSNPGLISTHVADEPERRVSYEDVEKGLRVIPADYFQVLPVTGKIKISEFVEMNGSDFQVGRGFYELTKSETIQERKQVVLQDRETGEFYSGAAARDMIGVEFGRRAKRFGPSNLPRDIARKYIVFVQSTSWNRNLVPHRDGRATMFLYQPRRESL